MMVPSKGMKSADKLRASRGAVKGRGRRAYFKRVDSTMSMGWVCKSHTKPTQEKVFRM
jgi:hypothetical protein